MAKPIVTAPAKRAGLVVQTIGREVLVYDPETHQAHSLNRSAALVFGQVDGRSGVSEIADKVRRELGAASPERVVRAALDRLGAAGLLTAPPSAGRRAWVRGLALALLPVVTSIVVPKAAAAASCAGLGSSCITPTTPCCPPYFCGGGGGTCILG